MLLELAFVACLAGADGKADETQCRDFGIAFAEENLTPYQCAMGGQAELAKWQAVHPQYIIMKFGCRRADGSEQDA